jgi:cell division protein FtsA
VRLGVAVEGLSGIADSVRRPSFAVAAGLALCGADRFGVTGMGASSITSGVFTMLGTWLKEFF